ncbi:unnamed protein product [Lupinus luteus]|uniref:Ycf2 N-terminal domain-containing protein n=1 Tax=Lupinus luteus TaxID=3873 RepID=A0AAV1WTU2_LUPLU
MFDFTVIFFLTATTFSFAFREKIPIEVEGFFKQEGVGSTIQSNDIEHVSHLFLRNKRAISLQNCAQFHMWQFRQDLFVSWGKNPHESDFLRNLSRANWIWLDNVWLVNKDRFFSKARGQSPGLGSSHCLGAYGTQEHGWNKPRLVKGHPDFLIDWNGLIISRSEAEYNRSKDLSSVTPFMTKYPGRVQKHPKSDTSSTMHCHTTCNSIYFMPTRQGHIIRLPHLPHGTNQLYTKYDPAKVVWHGKMTANTLEWSAMSRTTSSTSITINRGVSNKKRGQVQCKSICEKNFVKKFRFNSPKHVIHFFLHKTRRSMYA